MDNKLIITTRLNKFLLEKNFEEVKASMLAAESFGVSKPLLKRSYLFLGKSAIRDDQYSAILYLNKARVIDSVSKVIFENFLKAIQEFFQVNVEEFSKKDLEEYRQAILPIIEFHKLKFPAHRKIIDSMSHMFRRIDYRIKYKAKDVEESKITYRVQQIRNSLYGDMRPQEIKDEFARLIEDDLRNILDKPKDDKANKKKSGGTIKKNPPK
jgi:hypothetical protein